MVGFGEADLVWARVDVVCFEGAGASADERVSKEKGIICRVSFIVTVEKAARC